MRNLPILLFLSAFLLGSCGGVKQFTSSAPVTKAPAQVDFKTTIKGADGYEWDFGDGNTSLEANPSHIYYLGGTYDVTLKAEKGGKVIEQKKVVKVEEPAQYLVEMQTDMGNMTIELSKKTPKHTSNFLKLANEGFYDDLLFHRVIWAFMIQGGDPDSRGAAAGKQLGMGGPDYLIDAEFVDDMVHVKGALAAARTNNPQKRSSGSQFYIVHGRPVQASILDQVELSKGFKYTAEQRADYEKVGGTPHLDRDYTVFGRVIEGLGIIDQIAATETARGDRPKKDVKMKISLKR